MDSRKSRANMPDLIEDYGRVLELNPDATEEEILLAAREHGMDELVVIIEKGYLDELQKVYNRHSERRN